MRACVPCCGPRALFSTSPAVLPTHKGPARGRAGQHTSRRRVHAKPLKDSFSCWKCDQVVFLSPTPLFFGVRVCCSLRMPLEHTTHKGTVWFLLFTPKRTKTSSKHLRSLPEMPAKHARHRRLGGTQPLSPVLGQVLVLVFVLAVPGGGRSGAAGARGRAPGRAAPPGSAPAASRLDREIPPRAVPPITPTPTVHPELRVRQLFFSFSRGPHAGARCRGQASPKRLTPCSPLPPPSSLVPHPRPGHAPHVAEASIDVGHSEVAPRPPHELAIN